jgi:uncharacterized protein (TIGR02328 family)
MRLWHEALLPGLPRAQLLGQHRECCALRGLSWGKKHAVVDYVFTHPPEWLAAYHFRVMEEMDRRGYRVDPAWRDAAYRGRRRGPLTADPEELRKALGRRPVYPEHNPEYLESCMANLAHKGIRPEAGSSRERSQL